MYANSQEVLLEQAIIRSPLTIAASATVADAIALMSVGSQTCNLLCEIGSETDLQLSHAQNSCILVTEGKKLIGILTERDLVRLCGQNANPETSAQNSAQNLLETAIAEVMTYPVQSLLAWEFTDILVPINRFHRYKIRHLPLVNDLGEIVGLLTHESLRQLLRPIDMLRLRKVREVIITCVIHANPTASVAQIANLMLEKKVSSVVIVEEGDNGLCPVGIVTEGDIVQYLALELALATTSVQLVMSFPVATVSPDETLWTVREIMQERMINHLIVTNPDGTMEGIISQSDLLNTLQPTEIYKLVSMLETKMSRLEQEKLELLQGRNKLLESQVQASTFALAGSNNMFRQFAENNRGAIILREFSTGKVVYVSPRYADIWGHSSEYLYQNPDIWMQSIHPEDIDRVLQLYQLTVSSGFFSEEYRIIRPDGDIRWIWGRCFPLKNANGKIEQMAAIAEDISDRKIAEIALRESEQRLKASESLLSAMFERSVVGMAITDADGKFVRTNPFYQQMVGYSENELQLMRFTDNMLPEDIEDNLRLRTQVLSGESESYQLEKRLLHRDGKMLWVRTTSSKILDEVGQPPLFVGVIEDISDRKQAEESLQSLVEGTAAQTGENFLPALVQYIADALEVRYVFITQKKGGILEARAAWMDGQLHPTLYFSFADSPCTLTVKEGIFFCADNLQQHFAKCEFIENLDVDSYLGIAIANSKGEKIGSLCILDDKPISQVQRANAMLRVFAARASAEIERQEAIDDLYQLNQQLESRVAQRTQELQFTNQQLSAANNELAKATKLKDEFLANMSHELRTPLNAVLGMSEGLMTGVFGDLNERQMRSLSLIETSGRHLLELINDILDVAKIGAGKLDLDLSSVAIEYLCKSSLNFVKQIANQKNIQLKLSVNPSIKIITVDERRMRQALINLLSNAVKFTPKGGKVCLEVNLQATETTELTAECPYVMVFSIIDTGIGISPEDISNLFQAFVQIDSSLNRQYAGTGLGLTLVKQLAELHGGCVSVTSQVDKGSCFSIILPYTESIELDKLDRAKPPSNSFGESYNQASNLENNLAVNPLILLADDNPINIETFSNYLTNRGYRLIFASNGQEAINMTIAQNPDLILMDIQMPVLDGLSAIESIRANPDVNNIPIVALTALAMTGDREKCLAVGANEYLAKPVQLSHLTAIIQQQLQKPI
ncbi:circadian input kinase A [Pseudanabaena sp. lw0831]|uniref:PAS domain S-box protein n=1 Tax=Pseudanabaena sp. lw0831 TaxID=1357935 RepID=UPI0019154C33|nr:PAS domain S-box protein [Pseudanabaena sp. lw0831]GBO55449.1 circadian input kinase A [Pseudanabaena sp. lw0831]